MSWDTESRDCPPGDELQFIASEVEAGERVDVALSALAGVTRSGVRRWIDAGRVTVNGRVCRASQRVALGDDVRAAPPVPIVPSLAPEAIPLVVLHEDSDLIVIDKPAGLVVHPAPGHASGTLVNALLHHCGDLAGVGGVLRPGIVHRLDRGTSGVMVAAKNDAAHQSLSSQFHDHTIDRIYHAFVRGTPSADSGSVDRPIDRHPRDRKKMSVVLRPGRAGRAALTHWEVVERFPATARSHLEIRPQTGRTHQIRVHLASIGLPIVGDPVYGKSRSQRRTPSLSRPALHAALLGFEHPRGGKRLRFEAPLPQDMAGLRDALRAREGRR
jgi:23S rRNA pseudouridine1911/1915/1917 synthase